MKISLTWLQDYLNMPLDADYVVELLNEIGLEVEAVETVETIRGGLKNVVVGKVMECSPVEGSDHLNYTRVDVGGEELQPIVCGASNVAVGLKVIVALPGAVLYPTAGGEFQIKKAKIRGIESLGMICAEDEIGLGSSHAGIMVLDEHAVAGTPAARYFNLESDTVLHISLTPNRVDAASHIGVARDLLAALKIRKPENEVRLLLPDVSDFKQDIDQYDLSIEIKNAEACPRYTGLVLNNVKVSESPAWLQNRLKAVGLRPINVVVDATQYVMLETGHPLHAFDVNEIGGNKIVVRLASEGEPFITLDEVERKLNERDLMICDYEKPMCIAGVFGGKNSGVSMKTTTVFLESAYFNPSFIRKSARRHGLQTDASFRFERGADYSVTPYALKRAAMLIRELTGCEIASPVMDVVAEKRERRIIEIRRGRMNHFLGTEIGADDYRTILEALDFEILSEEDDMMRISVPMAKVDVEREVDVCEEIIRIYGYNRVPMPEKVQVSFGRSEGSYRDQFRRKISDFLTSRGMNEILNNSLDDISWYQKTGIFSEAERVLMLNPLSRELGVMRMSMLPRGLQSLAYNINRNAKDLRFYEFGKTYRMISADNSLPVDKRFAEDEMLALFVTGNDKPENWNNSSRKTDFYYLKSLAENLLSMSGLSGSVKVQESDSPVLMFGLAYYVGNQCLMQVGKVKKEIALVSDVEQDVWYAEINFDKMVMYHKRQKVSYREIPKFPSVRRDISIVLPKTVRYAELEKAAREQEKKLLRSVNLFDVYEGKNIPQDKISYALSFTFFDETKTLRDEDIDKVMEKISRIFAEKFGAGLR